jgi:hypothetical protein
LSREAVVQMRLCLSIFIAVVVACTFAIAPIRAQSRYASSDNMSGYVHWIELYDANNSRIDPKADNPPPYSPAKTCGRCHDFNSISHGWHFNATDADTEHGRPGQPWIWSDPRTGTHLPLSYRNWPGTYNPDELGLSRWQVAAKLGGFLPGGGPGATEAMSVKVPPAAGTTADGEPLAGSDPVDRSAFTGDLPVDCMLCHHNPGGGYSPFVWTEQIEDENFAYAPSAAVGIATITGSIRRLKEDFDPAAADASEKLPKVSYEQNRFRSDGKIFFDLIRKPKSDACYYCHTNVASDSVNGSRWLHDEDVHLRAGFQCADCHRNGIDHHTVRGFDSEVHPAGTSVASLSCQGCHVGGDDASTSDDTTLSSAGRLGAPMPAHRGLPPLHFEKMTCTACHSGPAPETTVGRQLNSIAHHLGAHVKRTGEEFPGIVGAVALPVSYSSTKDGAEEAKTYTPHRMMWPSFWATLADDKLSPLNPEVAYELVRKPLKVRPTKEFTEGLSEVKLLLGERKELIGEDRAKLKPEDWTPEEIAKITEAEAKAREVQVNERMAAALANIEVAFPNSTAVFVSGGAGFARDGDSKIKMLEDEQLGEFAKPYAWPLAHNVRPARQALGATGCLECHSDGSTFFGATIQPVGLLPGQKTVAVKAHEMQGADMERLRTWNQLFAGRSVFKILGLIALGLTCVLTLSAVAWNLGSFVRR